MARPRTVLSAIGVVAVASFGVVYWTSQQDESSCVQASYDFAADADGNATKEGAVRDWYTYFGSRQDAPPLGWRPTVFHGEPAMKQDDWTLVLYRSQNGTWLVASVECAS